eukprot:g11720.t1
MFMDMKNVAWGGHCFLHDESCHFRPKVCIMEEVQSIEDTFPGLEEATGVLVSYFCHCRWKSKPSEPLVQDSKNLPPHAIPEPDESSVSPRGSSCDMCFKTALDYMMHKFKTALPAYNAEIFRVQTSDWNIPQSRGRIYILLVRNNLASVEDLKMFHHLFDQFLPKNTPERKTTVKQDDYIDPIAGGYIVDLARSYDRRTLSASQISALTSNVRLFDIAAKELLCGQDCS